MSEIHHEDTKDELQRNNELDTATSMDQHELNPTARLKTPTHLTVKHTHSHLDYAETNM